MATAADVLKALHGIATRLDPEMSEKDVENSFLDENFYRLLGYQGSGHDLRSEYRTLVATICATLGQPLPEEAWDGAELFTGDDFWGDIDVPFADAVVADGAVDTHARVN